jgi:hypothetical protein
MPPYGQPTKPKNTKRTVKTPGGAQVYVRGKNLEEKKQTISNVKSSQSLFGAKANAIRASQTATKQGLQSNASKAEGNSGWANFYANREKESAKLSKYMRDKIK